VQVIGCADDDGVDIPLICQHAPEIAMPCDLRHVLGDQLLERGDTRFAVAPRVRGGDFGKAVFFALQIGGQCIPRPAREIPIDVAQRDDVVVDAEVEQVDPAHAANADARDVQTIAGRSKAATEHVAGDDGECRAGDADISQELPSRNRHCWTSLGCRG